MQETQNANASNNEKLNQIQTGFLIRIFVCYHTL